METAPATHLSILGVRMKVPAIWLLIAALMIWTATTTYFPHITPGLHRADHIALSVIAFAGLIASLILHEAAQWAVARHFALDPGTITLFAFGGLSTLEEDPRSPQSEIWIAAAGPAASLALAGLTFLALSAMGGTEGAQVVKAMLSCLLAINLMLVAVNLVPAYPLDAGRALRAALWHRSGDLVGATRIAARTGRILGLALILSGFSFLLWTDHAGGLWATLIGLQLQSAARTGEARVMHRLALADKTVEMLMTPAPWTADPQQTLADLVNTVMLAHAVSFVPVCEGDQLLGHIDTQGVNLIDREHWSAAHVADVFTALDGNICIPPDLPTGALLQKMLQTGARKFMIVRQQHLIGVITLSDLMSYLSVLAEVGGLAAPPARPHDDTSTAARTEDNTG